MKNKKLPVIGYLVIGVLLAVLLMACAGPDRTQSEEQEFSVYTWDQNGRKVYGYQREADGICYLFVPSVQSIPDMEVHCSEEIAETSRGKVGKDGCTISGAFASSGDEIDIITSEGETHTIVVMQSDLPSVQIYLKGVTLEELHEDKNAKYPDMTFILSDPQGSYDLSVANGAEIKGRGNSTWLLYEKKGYQVKFGKELSVLGMEPAKKWVLLANSSDDSMIRSQLVYRMAAQMDMAFVPSFEYVDLWIDGEYLGTYLLGEKVEIENSRLNLTQPRGVLWEHDEGFYEEEEYWLYSTWLERHFTLKDIAVEKKANIDLAMESFETAVDELTAYLYSTPSDQVTLEALSSMIDVDSFAKYYLINEYVLNQESYSTSFYWYQDGEEDVLHLGPIWDFDTCMGNDSAEYTGNYGHNHRLFRYLLAAPEFRARTEALYAEYQHLFTSMVEDVDVLKEKIRQSATMNYLRWDVLGKPSVKTFAMDFHDTFDEAVEFVKTWLSGRETCFSIDDPGVITSEISEDCRTMTLRYRDDQMHDSIRFALWNVEQGTDYVQWYNAEYVDGTWQCLADLSWFEAAGMYSMDVYVDNETTARTTGCNYVINAVESQYSLDVAMAQDDRIMEITLVDRDPCVSVSFAVWSEASAQTDLQWFEAERNSDGLWEYQVDMSMYQTTGKYFIHAYGVKADGTTIILDVGVVTVDR